MKKIVIAIAAALMAAQSYADLNINWNTASATVFRNDGTTPLLTSGSALFQLIYSPDNNAGQALTDGTAENDTILEQLVVDSSTADTGAEFFSDSYSQSFISGFVYMRVFDVGTSVGNTPALTWYLTGNVTATTDILPPTPNQEVRLGATVGGTYTLNQQVVPEPTAIAFLAIGGALVAVRRMRKA